MIVRCRAYRLARESPFSITERSPKGNAKVKALYYEYSGQLMYSRQPNRTPKSLSHDHACQQRVDKVEPFHYDLTTLNPSLPVAPPLLNAAVDTRKSAFGSRNDHPHTAHLVEPSFSQPRSCPNSLTTDRLCSPEEDGILGENVPSASSQARPAPKPSPVNTGQALRLKSSTEKMTPKERPREERTRKDEIAWSHYGFVLG